MGLRINQNIAAMNAYRNLSVNDGQMSKSLERLSSGLRINRAADDAAGMSVSESLRSQIGGMKVAVRNAQDGINVVQTAEGALTEVHSVLQRMRDLAVQASNSGSQDSAARTAAQSELAQLNQELTRIGGSTTYGGQSLLKGTPAATSGAVVTTAGSLTTSGADFQLSGVFKNATTGANVTLTTAAVTVADATYNSAGAYQTALQTSLDSTLSANNIAAGSVKANVSDVGGGVWKVELSTGSLASGTTFSTGTSDTAGVTASATSSSQANAFTGTFQVGAYQGEKIDIQFKGVSASILGTGSLDLVGNAASAIGVIDTAIASVSSSRADLGAFQNRFEHTINNLNVAVENLSASDSRIRDTDMAQEMVSFTRSQILSQAGTAMLAQANQAPMSVLKLLG